MKKDVHPTYYEDAKISCACGATYQIGSTVKDIQVELCAACHPFYTGAGAKIIDAARRVEKFQERVAKSKTSVQATGKKVKRVKRATHKKEKEAKGEEK
ncbi:MAG TPA: 50S ribosomal protein L31 [Patescibacteria group bacterium]|nr:50S ribosomal protein L31 [Patescibacteria group bacterium]